MFDKTQYANSIIIGCRVTEQPFFLAQISVTEEFVLQGNAYKGYILELQDKTGTISGFLPQDKYLPEYDNLENKVVAINGTCLKSTETYIKVDSLQVVTEGNYEAKEFMLGLSEKMRGGYITLLGREIANVKGNYRSLLDAVFTEEVVKRVGDLPASLKQFANYHGGLLAATVTVNAICRQTAKTYFEYRNRIYDECISEIDTDLLETASLLWGIGKLREWTDFPYKKSNTGKILGTVGTLQGLISEKCNLPNVSVTPEEQQALIGTIIPAIDGRSQVKAVGKEAIILQQALMLYRLCDENDHAVNVYTGDEDIFYSWPIKSYVRNPRKRVKDFTPTAPNTPKEVA